MAMTTEERAQKTAWLKQAETAYHTLRTGAQARVFVDSNGERVEFAVANADRLRAYIAELREELGIRKAVTGPLTPWMM
jgi:hypothetical protein